MNTQELELLAGAVGAFFDDVPRLTTAIVRPYVIAILLHRGAVSPREVLASLTPHCQHADLKVGGYDDEDDGEEYEGTRAESLIDEVLGELVIEGILRYSESKDLWILTTRDLSRVISWTAALGGRIPQHLLSEISHQQARRFTTPPKSAEPVEGFIPWDGTDIEPTPTGFRYV